MYAVEIARQRNSAKGAAEIMAQPVVHFEFWSEEPGKVSDFY